MRPGDHVFVDIHAWYGSDWFDTLDLPYIYPKRYVVEFIYTRWYHDIPLKTQRVSKQLYRKITAVCPILNNIDFNLDPYHVFAFGSQLTFNHETMVLITPELVAKYPAILQ